MYNSKGKLKQIYFTFISRYVYRCDSTSGKLHNRVGSFHETNNLCTINEILQFNQAPYEWKLLDPFQGDQLTMRYHQNYIEEKEIELVENIPE